MDSVGPDHASMNRWVSDAHGDERDKSRQRTNMACVHCRRRKIRCDGKQPSCSNCRRLGKLCDYEPISEEENLVAREKKRASRLKKAQQNANSASSSRLPATPLHPGGFSGQHPQLRWDGASYDSSRSESPLSISIPDSSQSSSRHQPSRGRELRYPQSSVNPLHIQQPRRRGFSGSESQQQGFGPQSSQQWPSSASASSAYPPTGQGNFGPTFDNRVTAGGNAPMLSGAANLGDDLPVWARTTFANQPVSDWTSSAGGTMDPSHLGAYDGTSSAAYDSSGGISRSHQLRAEHAAGSVGLVSPQFSSAGPPEVTSVNPHILQRPNDARIVARPLPDGQDAHSAGYWPSAGHQAGSAEMHHRGGAAPPRWPTQVQTESWMQNMAHQQPLYQQPPQPGHSFQSHPFEPVGYRQDQGGAEQRPHLRD